MKQAFLLSILLFAITITVTGQTIAYKLPDMQKQEQIHHCGNKSIWIKGHWQWDESQQSYVWEKGKCMPHKKGHTYIPGRWVKVAEGWKWQAGSWKKI
ncbi:MAG: hypothetical protein AAF927_30520 [Bacteroidota bacterium]